MDSIVQNCEPRPDLLQGTFNPEIFTASLGGVIKSYRGEGSSVHSIYTDAEEFFREATYPSEGLKSVVNEVFMRLAGDNTIPAIHRLETGFGGGKTHTLIACTHIGFKGSALAGALNGLIDAGILPAPGSVHVVGVAGDRIPVHKPRGDQLLPHTLWGEIAFQVGGETLYRSVQEEAESFAAPGENYFNTVFGGRKILLMIDELAQYAARFSAARPEARQQLEAFLLPLHGYARENPGIAIVETLASAKDAFASQTEMLAKLLSQVTGQEIGPDTALGIGQQAIDGIASVVARDASAVVPVLPAEISRVLAKRLFIRIDPAGAAQTAAGYAELYQKNSSLLPDEATRTDYPDRLAANYPFHPTLINFLNHKLAAYENFQGTRGVLRVLALAVRSIWQKKLNIPMIHTCHLDMRETRTVSEVVGRTGSGDLLTVLNADVGGADTGSLTGGRSNAELADLRNPHPEGWPLYEYTWKTVFLHSLVGREQGLGSSIFGLTEPEALFEISFPGLTPPQVAEALKEIDNSAYYLRFNQGRYYASLEPSINIALAQIRRSLTLEEIQGLLDVFGRKVVAADTKVFHVVPDVTLPDHIPDKNGLVVLAIASLNAERIEVDGMFTTAGPNRPRLDQNRVLLLTPETVEAGVKKPGQAALFDEQSNSAAQQSRQNLYDLARTVLAMRRLAKNPQSYGIQPQRLQKDDFKQRFNEREKALETAVTESYRYLWYPSAGGRIVFKEIRTAGGEGGVSVLEQIRQTLVEDGELITADRVNRETIAGLRKIFFSGTEVIKLGALRENFARIRNWPMLESMQVLDQIVRTGVAQDAWCLFRMGSEDAVRPEEFYSREGGEVPLHLELQSDHGIVTPEGAHQRGWTKAKGLDPAQVQQWVKNVVYEMQAGVVDKISDKVVDRYGEVPEKATHEAITKLVQDTRIMAYKGDVEQTEKPEMIHGTNAVFYIPDKNDVLITPSKASEKGWISEKDKRLTLTGKEGRDALLPLLRRIGSLYQKGGKTPIDMLDLTDLELPAGGTLRISLADVPPESLKDMGELFEILDALVEAGDSTDVFLQINTAADDCPFLAELLKKLAKER